MRVPNMMAENTSRPWSSVPSRYPGLLPAMPAGGASASLRFSVLRSNGLCGATQGANRAAPRHTKRTIAETIATGECRKLQPTSLFQAAARLTWRSASPSRRAPPGNPRRGG